MEEGTVDIVADEMEFDSQSWQCLKITWGAFSKYKFPATLSPIDLDSLRGELQEFIFMWFVNDSKTEKQDVSENLKSEEEKND